MYARIDKKKKKDNMDHNKTGRDPVEQGSPPPRKRRSPKKEFVPTWVRDAILLELDRKGREAVAADIAAMCPGKTRDALASTLSGLVHEPNSPRTSTTIGMFTRLATQYKDRPALGPSPLPGPKPERVHEEYLSDPPAALQRYEQPPVSLDMKAVTETMVAAVSVAMATAFQSLFPQQQQTAPQSPRLSPSSTDVTGDFREPGIKPFEELDVRLQRQILNSMHNRYSDRLGKEYGIIGGGHSAAWDLSYEAYARETGNEVKKRASAESDATGKRVRPLDLIERDGDIVRFWRVVRRLWEKS